MSYKINRVPAGIYSDFYSGNTKAYKEAIFDVLEKDVDSISLSSNRYLFKAVCLTESPSPSATEQAGFINGHKLVDLGDGIPRYAIRFRIVDGNYDTNDFGLTDVIPNPFDPNISDTERRRRISMHPIAYTEISSKYERFFTFGSTMTVKFIGNSYIVKSIFGNGMALGTGGPINALGVNAPGMVQESTIGPQFAVNGVRYVSLPATNAANRAVALYESAKAAGMTDRSKKWETTPEGRAWVSKNIYDGLFPGKGNGAKYGPRLGTPDESFWSSWFHNMAHQPYKKKFGKKGGVYTYVGYPAKYAYAARQRVEKDLQSHIGKELFCVFRPTEAPIYPGDSLFNWRAGMSGKSYTSIPDGGPSHMTIFSRQEGNSGFFHGGNEMQKVGNRKFDLKAGNYLADKHHKKFVAIYKKVKVVGAG